MTALLVFDFETKRLSKDIAPDGKPIGWSAPRLPLMGIAWAVTWDRVNGLMHYMGDRRSSLGELALALSDADLIVSYNGVRFDIPLLNGILLEMEPPPPLQVKRHCDLLEIIYRACGRRYSLDDMAQANLGMSKLGDGEAPPKWYQDGWFDNIASYCARDVEITRDLFFLAAARGWLLSPNGEEILCPVPGGLP